MCLVLGDTAKLWVFLGYTKTCHCRDGSWLKTALRLRVLRGREEARQDFWSYGFRKNVLISPEKTAELICQVLLPISLVLDALWK